MIRRKVRTGSNLSVGLRARRLVAACGGIAVLIVTGCGGDGTIPKDDYVKRVTRRCNLYGKERERAQSAVTGNPLGSPGQLRDAAPAIVEVNNTLRIAIADLKAIPDPDKGASRVQTMFAAADEGIAALSAADAAAREGDIRGIKRAFKDVDASLARANETGKEFGFTACAG